MDPLRARLESLKKCQWIQETTLNFRLELGLRPATRRPETNCFNHKFSQFLPRTKMRLVAILETLLVVVAAASAAKIPWPSPGPETNWFSAAGHGVFTHYLDALQNDFGSNSQGKNTTWSECVDGERWQPVLYH
jgi:hypothetical protein